jgi:hypothetical protein
VTIDAKAIERRVMADRDRPCLYGVMGPCFHPKCLEAHFKTLHAEAQLRALIAAMREIAQPVGPIHGWWD